MIRTIKKEVIWLEEFASFSEAKEKISPWIEQDYNPLYPHSVLGYRSPVEFEALGQGRLINPYQGGILAALRASSVRAVRRG